MNIIPEITRESITQIINDGERVDGRTFDQYRGIQIETDIISKAEGSARAKIGYTQVIAGVKVSIGEPFPDTPNLGVLITNTEVLPIADPSFEPGPPNEDSVELARVVDRAIRESGMIDLEKLCIEEGRKVWMLFVDLHIIDYDGNLFDTATLAAVSALLNTKLPKTTLDDGEVIINDEIKEELVLNNKVTMSTFVKIGDKMVLDPSLEEETILDGRLSVGVTESGKICAMQKGGDKSLLKEDIFEAVNMAISKSKELIKEIDS
ncbi:MAG: exosome complex protein Rrp42 [Methanobrevibacter sp.]|jgi:exosome complex component RRP42|nr:exosome complex protein Rrp42 [Candidatus Methanovirga aequatorialis]